MGGGQTQTHAHTHTQILLSPMKESATVIDRPEELSLLYWPCASLTVENNNSILNPTTGCLLP